MLAVPLLAQGVPEDAMEVQRCVWRCLDASPGAESTEYHACVAEKCGEAEAPPAASKKPPAWSVVEDYEGRGRAGWATDAVMGTELFVFCAHDGSEQFIDLLGAEGPDAVLELNIDGEQVFRLVFRNVEGRARAVLEPAFAEIAALKAGNSLALLNDAGYSVFSSSLRGSTKALNVACGDMSAAVAVEAPAEAVTVPVEPVEVEAVADVGEAAAAPPALRGEFHDLDEGAVEQMCVAVCLAVAPGPASPEFATCAAETCGAGGLSRIVGGADDPALTTARAGDGPFSPMPWSAPDIPACMASCEELTPGTASIEYRSCVVENCDRDHGFADFPDPARSVRSPSDDSFVLPSPVWEVWSSDDGQARLAGMTDPNSGNRFAVWCPVDGGARSFVLEGPLTPALTLHLGIMDMPLLLRFRPEGTRLRAALPAAGREIDVLAKAAQLHILMGAGTPLVAIGMNSAAEAIVEACP
jgi:hypothetical protein